MSTLKVNKIFPFSGSAVDFDGPSVPTYKGVPLGSGGGSGSGSAMPTVKDSPFSAVGNGSAPDQPAFTAASTAHPQFRVPPGTYRFTTNTTITSAMAMDAGAIISVDTGIVVTIAGVLEAGRTLHFTGAGSVVFAPGSVDHVKAEWFGLATTATEANNVTALQRAWAAAFGTGLTIGRGAFPLGDTELKAKALSNTSQLPNFFMGSGVDGNGGGGGVSANVGTSFVGPSARIHFLNDSSTNSDAKIIISGFHIVGPNDNVPGMGGLKMTKLSGAIVEAMQVTGSRSHGAEFIDCYGVVVRDNTFLNNRQNGIVCNQRFNQSVLRANKCIGNVKDYTGIYGNIAFSGGSGLESLGPVIEANDTSYAGIGAVLYKRNNPTPGPLSITLTNIVVSGSVATATTSANHGRSTGDRISVLGATVSPALNTFFTPTITVTGPTTFTWTTSAAPGTYTESTLVIGPAAYGSIFNDIRGAIITIYAEDCIGLAAYVGSNVMASRISGGYDQGFNIPGGGSGVIVLDNCSYVNVDSLSLSGANSILRVATTERKHGVNIDSTVTVENGAQIQYGVIEMRDGQYYASAQPSAGTWKRGDWVQNLLATPGAPQGWYCSEAPATFVAIDAAGGGSSLPAQTGNAGKVLGTNGTAVSWVDTTSSLPPLSGNAGRFLGTDSISIGWYSVVGSLPPQSPAVAGRFLTTDGTNSSWALVTGGSLPDQAGNSGRLLSTNGSTPNWATNVTLTNITVTGGITTATLNTTGNGTVSGVFTGGTANFSGNVAAAGHVGGIHTGTSASFSGGLSAASIIATGGGANISGNMSVSAASGSALNISAPGSGTALRLTTSGGGTTGMTIDGSSGGVAMYVIGSLRFDPGTASGSATGNTSTLASKPGSTTNAVWIPVNMNGVPGDILWWPRN